MRRFLCILLVNFFPNAVIADDVLVSIGHSPNATRLVLTFQSRPEWSVIRLESRLNLRFETSGYSIRDFDAAIARKDPRIEAISEEGAGNGFSINLSCACDTDVYPFGDGSLVVEIRDSISRVSVATENDEALRKPSHPFHPEINQSLAVTEDASTPAPRPENPEYLSATEFQSSDSGRLTRRNFDPNSGLMDTLGFDVSHETKSQAVEMISRQLSRAASQGLVAAGPELQNDRNIDTRGTTSELLSDRSNIKIETSLDRAIAPADRSHSPTRGGTVCFSDSEVDVVTWSHDSGISEIGQLRRSAFSENGQVTHEGARSLARFYLSLGFGSEAHVATRFMNDGRSKQLLQALADIVDHGKSDTHILDGQIYCDGQIALWAALARPIEKSDVPDSTDSILATFSGLAPHHRAHLGPVIAERLREVGLDTEARNAVSAVARGGLQSNESELVTARLELEGTRPELARETLVEISNGTDVTAAEALLELLEDAERRRMAPNPAWVEDAPSLARATEGTEVASLLNLAGLRGRVALGQFDELRLALAEDTPGLNHATRQDLAASGVVQAAKDAEDSAFLRAEIAFSKLFEVQDIESSDRFLVARKLLSIGLASRAQKYLIDEPQTIEEVETASDILSANGRTNEAVELLTAQENAKVALQLGRLLSSVGENDSAIKAFESDGLIEEAAQSAIRAGNWNWIAERNIEGTSGVLSDAARLLALPAEVSEEVTEEPANGQLIVSSQQLRAHAKSLLSETELSSDSTSFMK